MTDHIPRDGDAVVENLRHQLRQLARVLTPREMYEVLRFDRRWHTRAFDGPDRRSA